MKTILVSAFPLSPIRGSEFAVGWNYVEEMAKDNKLIVLYGTTNGYFGTFDDLSRFMDGNIANNVTFIPVHPAYSARFIRFCFRLDKKGRFVFYWFFRNWHKIVYKKAINIIKNENVDVVHYLNPVGFKEPGYLWKLDHPYIWGPIAGVHEKPKALFKQLTFAEKAAARSKNFVLHYLFRFSPRVKKAIRRADAVFSVSTTTQRQLMEIHQKTSLRIPESGILKIETTASIEKSKSEKLRLVWIGAICMRKNLVLLLDTLSSMKDNAGWELHVVGTGEQEKRLKDFARKRDIDRQIVWHGLVPRKQVQEIIKNSHLLLITSLNEGTPTIIWEAMSKAVPTMTLDHCGMADAICEKCGIKIPIHTYEQVKNDIATNIKRLLENPAEITRLSRGTLECAEKFTWNKRREFFNRQYEAAIKKFEKKRSDEAPGSSFAN